MARFPLGEMGAQVTPRLHTLRRHETARLPVNAVAELAAEFTIDGLAHGQPEFHHLALNAKAGELTSSLPDGDGHAIVPAVLGFDFAQDVGKAAHGFAVAADGLQE